VVAAGVEVPVQDQDQEVGVQVRRLLDLKSLLALGLRDHLL
jgi:hypothetical protein